MSKKVKEITADEWIDAMFQNYNDAPPKGSFTLKDLMKRTGYKENTARMRLGTMVAENKLSKKKYLVNGKLTNYYLPIGKQTK